MTLPSNPKQIRRVEAFLKRVNRSAHLDEIQMHKIMVSLTEAVNNAIIHGNKCDQKKKVHVRCELLPGWLVVFISDEGKGFQPEKVRNPLRKQNLMRESGRGVFLMKTLMDKVGFEMGSSGAQVALWLDMKK
ncbi:MAG: putative anti-sigma regulatory factor, serine/threonine protein kinase [Bacteroidetes bacterium]|nr:putative anti-sigma regulatory factor, serine/threonine protein kinase [Bacteroidota bacterium]